MHSFFTDMSDAHLIAALGRDRMARLFVDFIHQCVNDGGECVFPFLIIIGFFIVFNSLFLSSFLSLLDIERVISLNRTFDGALQSAGLLEGDLAVSSSEDE